MTISRREVPSTAADQASPISPTSVYPGTTSWDFTVQRASYTADGYQTLVAGDGEPHVVRKDLWPHQGHATQPLVAFAQMSDLHIVDDQSPARVEFLDKYADPPYVNYPTGSSYRPHEYLSTQVVDAMCLAIKSLGKAPRTRLPLTFTIVTGDAVDNCQHNENRWYIDLLDGGQAIRPDSGRDGQDLSFSSGALSLDPHYYYPSIPGSQIPDNLYSGAGAGASAGNGTETGTASLGFPYVPGLLSTTTVGAARRPYTSHGLGMPWYATYGNHDGLWQGNQPIDGAAFDPKPIALGSMKLRETAYAMPKDFQALGDLGEFEVSHGLFGLAVPADPTRRLLTRTAFVEDHFDTRGTPVGHGFLSPDDDRAHYAIGFTDDDLVRFITLDSTNPDPDGFGSGSPSGSIGVGQMSWLEGQLRANSRRYADSDGNVVTVPADSPVQDKMFVLFCHHSLDTMDDQGAGLEALLHRYPNVIAMVTGHTHANKITPHARPQGSAFTGGFWEISTASHIDWPIQSRIVEIAASREGIGGRPGDTPTPATISIFTTMIDPAAPLSCDGDLNDSSQLASLARELAANDPQEVRAGIRRRMGRASDRNTQLLLAAPFPINAPHRVGPPIAATRGTGGRLALFGTDVDGILATTADTTPEGKVELFTLDTDGVIWHRTQTDAGDSQYTEPTALDGTGFTTMATVNSGSGLMLFATTTSGGILNRWQDSDSGSWGPWQEFPGAAVQLAAEQNSKGFPVLVALNEDGLVFRTTGQHAKARTPSDFSPLLGLDGTLDSVALTRTADGRLALFGSTGDGQLLQRYEAGPGTDVWEAWTPIPTRVGIAPLRIRHVAAARNGAGVIELFVMDADGAVHRSAQPSADSFAWTPWTGVGSIGDVGFGAQPTATV